MVQYESAPKSSLKEQQLALAQQMTKRLQLGKGVDEFWCVPQVKSVDGMNVKPGQSEVQGCL